MGFYRGRLERESVLFKRVWVLCCCDLGLCLCLISVFFFWFVLLESGFELLVAGFVFL